MKQDEYGRSFADSFLERADHLVSVASLRLDLAAARQRLDRSLLALGEATFKHASEAGAIMPTALDNSLEQVRRVMQDVERLQERLDKLRERRQER